MAAARRIADTPPQRQPAPTLLGLANARRSRRPPGVRTPTAADPFASHAAAAAFVRSLGVSHQLGEDELDDLRALIDETQAITEALVSGRRPPSIGTINRLAAQVGATQSLRVSPEGRLTADIHWHADSAVAEVARRIVAELGRLDPARLRRCDREACDLLFYDTTRSRTQRWHSESPCGNRERQERLMGRRRDRSL